MLDTKTVPDLASDYRYALDVMEEYSHLGLDSEHCKKLREILLRHIDETEDAACSCCPASPLRFPTQREKVAQ
jgi:hypothetical protein